jgi:small multidrug resistance pump
MRIAADGTGPRATAAPRSIALISLRNVIRILEALWSRQAVKTALTIEQKPLFSGNDPLAARGAFPVPDHKNRFLSQIGNATQLRERTNRTCGMIYALLTVAIIAEVIGTLALKQSDGFSKLQPSLVVIAGYGLAFFLVSIVLRTLPVGITYAIWAGCGTMLVLLISAVIFEQWPDMPALTGIALITAGIIVINLGSQSTAQ